MRQITNNSKIQFNNENIDPCEYNESIKILKYYIFYIPTQIQQNQPTIPHRTDPHTPFYRRTTQYRFIPESGTFARFTAEFQQQSRARLVYKPPAIYIYCMPHLRMYLFYYLYVRYVRA